jgi:hypothetical protein
MPSNHTTSSSRIYTPQSSETHSSVLDSHRPVDREVGPLEYSLDTFSKIFDDFLILEAETENNNIGDLSMVVDWTLHDDSFHVALLKTEPWVGVAWDGPDENDLSMNNWFSAEIDQALETDVSAPLQSAPSENSSLPLRGTSQEPIISFQQSNLDPEPERPSIFRQDTIPEAPPQPSITSNVIVAFPKQKKPPNRRKAATIRSSPAGLPPRIEKVTKAAKKARRLFNPDERFETACTRKSGAFVRCRMQKTRVHTPKHPT